MTLRSRLMFGLVMALVLMAAAQSALAQVKTTAVVVAGDFVGYIFITADSLNTMF